MQREIHSWWSSHLNKQMEIVAYGHYGPALLMFPTAAADFLEYERFHLVDAIRPFIEAGKIKAYSINSINSESWLNSDISGREKIVRHMQYNNYLTDEVAPFIFQHCNGKVPIITTGASLGAFHAANSLFRRPDLFDGTIAMSGIYDLKSYSKGYYDDDCYYNSPVDYMPHLQDENYLPLLQEKTHIHFVSGRGKYEAPQASELIAKICDAKGIPNTLDLWGYDIDHDWPSWRSMLPHYLEHYF